MTWQTMLEVVCNYGGTALTFIGTALGASLLVGLLLYFSGNKSTTQYKLDQYEQEHRDRLEAAKRARNSGDLNS